MGKLMGSLLRGLLLRGRGCDGVGRAVMLVSELEDALILCFSE